MTYAVNYSSRFMEKPHAVNIINIKRALMYLNGKINVGIKFCANSDDKQLDAYCDSDYTEDPISRRSTTG